MRPRHALLAAGAAAVLAASGIAVMNAAASSTGCSVAYTVDGQWPGGFLANLRITNLGDPLSGWTLGFDFPDSGQKVSNGWSADWSQSGTRVTAKSMAWNGSVGANQAVAVGLVGTFSAANPVPASFTVNGMTCTGSATPTPTATTPTPTATTPTPTSSGPAPALHVSGNQLLAADGRAYRLLGVNRSSAEFACVQGKGMWDSATPDQATVDAMKAWNVHSVRIPLNEQCWLGTNGTPSGTEYQTAVKDYVNLLVSNGINPILDMHWNYGSINSAGNGNCTDVNATCQKPMPDAEYAPQFWSQVATAFKGNNAVIFDLFNEPWPDAPANWDATLAWTCWRDGGTCTGIPYQVAGMQTLVNAVRDTGAGNVIMLGGLTWSNDLTQWLSYEPTDPKANLVASWHTYNFNSCSNTSCWDSQVAPVAAKVPVVAGEIGQNSCAHDYIDQVMAWADSHKVSYLAWTWNPWGCSSGNVLITNYDGTPTSTYGEGYKAHLLTQDPWS